MKSFVAALFTTAIEASMITASTQYDPFDPSDPAYDPNYDPAFDPSFDPTLDPDHGPTSHSHSHESHVDSHSHDHSHDHSHSNTSPTSSISHGFTPYIHHHSGLKEGHYNPWTGESTTALEAEFEGWYSPFQKYSPPYKAYKPETTDRTEYATCTFANSPTAPTKSFLIQFAQRPGKAVNAQITATGFTASLGHSIRIHEYGRMQKKTNTCDQVGKEFRPLEEVDKEKRVNPFQDPDRGRIPD